MPAASTWRPLAPSIRNLRRADGRCDAGRSVTEPKRSGCTVSDPRLQRAFGPDHRDTLATRESLASLIGTSGDSAEAIRLCHELIPDLVRTLGPDHSDTLTTRHLLAQWRWRQPWSCSRARKGR